MKEVSLVLDFGKSNKKLLLFDAELQVVEERQVDIPEIESSDGLFVEDVTEMWRWSQAEFRRIASEKRFTVRAINITTFGATVVHLDARGQLALPVVSYVNKMAPEVDAGFRVWMHSLPGDFARRASPFLANLLNVGKQLFWLEHYRSEQAATIAHTLFLPQYFVYLLTGELLTEPTSYGCHTALWDFHDMRPCNSALSGLDWREKMPPLAEPTTTHPLAKNVADMLGTDKTVAVGTGLHDSSSALVPYLRTLQEKFILVSTGTWVVVMNPDAAFALSADDLARDRLYYLTPEKRPVRAARLFAGKEHDIQLQRIEQHFGRKPAIDATDLPAFLPRFFIQSVLRALVPQVLAGTGPFPRCAAGEWALDAFTSPEEAYARLCLDLAVLTSYCIDTVSLESSSRIVVDGGFAQNAWFVRLLAAMQKPRELFVAEAPQATALGAALQVHPVWAKTPAPEKILALQEIPAENVPGLRVYAERYLAKLEDEESGT